MRQRTVRDSAATAAIVARTGEALAQLLNEPLAPGLYIVATPIGNLGDVSLRALSILARADTLYCEDTRHSARLLQHFSIVVPTRPFHEHNEDAETPRILAALKRGERIAVISDAGTPLVSDPGFKLVRAAAAAGHPVFAVPGASAVLTALSASGLPTDAFFFAGFLPPKSAARRTRLAELSEIPASLVFFEAPQRVAETLGDMAEVLGSRPAVVARELTKLHEEIARGSLSDLDAAFAARDLKGEVVIVAGPPGAKNLSDAEIEVRLASALENMRLKDAAAAVAEVLGVSKARVYDLGIKLKNK